MLQEIHELLQNVIYISLLWFRLTKIVLLCNHSNASLKAHNSDVLSYMLTTVPFLRIRGILLHKANRDISAKCPCVAVCRCVSPLNYLKSLATGSSFSTQAERKLHIFSAAPEHFFFASLKLEAIEEKHID